MVSVIKQGLICPCVAQLKGDYYTGIQDAVGNLEMI